MRTIITIATLLFSVVLPNSTMAGSRTHPLPPIRPVDQSTPFLFQNDLPNIPEDVGRRYTAIDTGGSFTCAIRAADRGIDCWGHNELGQGAAPQVGRYKTLSLGGRSACALTMNNRLVCWGHEGSRPGPGQARHGYRQVSVGEGHVCAIRASNHKVDCWGDNGQGQLNHPQGGFKAISARNGKTCGLKLTNGALECWGDKAFLRFVRPSGRFSDLTVGSLHGCVVHRDDQRVICWGNGPFEEDLPPTGQFRALTSGTNHTCGQRIDNTVACWGRNQSGQADMPRDIRLHSLNAGGMQTTALDNSGHLVIRGSFAWNDLLFPLSPARSESTNDGNVTTSIAVIDEIASEMVTGFIGNLLTNWGDSVGGKAGGFLLFVGGLLGGDSDKTTIEEIKKIQDKLDALATGLSRIDAKSIEIIKDIKSLNCDDKLGDIDNAVLNIHQAYGIYLGDNSLTDTTTSLITQVRDELTRAQQQGYVRNDLRPLMHHFVKQWYDPVSSDMNRINEILTNANYKDGPLSACLSKSYMNYQAQSGDKQWDDRQIWTGIYWILQRAMIDQAKAAQLLLDMNKFKAITSLSDESVEPSTPIIKEGNGWSRDTLCHDVELNSKLAAKNLRWNAALQACHASQAVTRALYINLVHQIEIAGAPFTNNNLMMSFGTDIHADSPLLTSKLFLRDADFGAIKTSFQSSLIQGQESFDFTGYGDANIYLNAGISGSTWVPTGSKDWERLSTINNDVLSYLGDSINKVDNMTLFNPTKPSTGKSIKTNAFWKGGSQEFDLDLNDLTKQRSHNSSIEVIDYRKGLGCFVVPINGIICSTDDFGKLVDGYLWENIGSTGIGQDKYVCDPEWILEAEWPYSSPNKRTCTWIKPISEFMNKNIGNLEVHVWSNYFGPSGSSPYDHFYLGPENIVPDLTSQGISLSVLPNVDLNGSRKCSESLITSGSTRLPYRDVTSNDGSNVRLPSRCGVDLDYFVEQIIKRPDVPGLDDLVRKASYPRGVTF